MNRVCANELCGRDKGRETGRFCSRCKRRNWELKNPVHAVWLRLKWSAKRRNLYFGITLIEFEAFCELTDYIHTRGRGPYDMSIDRIDEERGYEPDNIQVLSNAANFEKYKLSQSNLPF